MSVNCVANPCPVITNSSCVFYQGPNLICLGVNTNDTIENALIKINAVICDVAGLDGTSGTSGTSGSSGSSGTSGSNGSSGTSGSDGTSGSTGNGGSSGSSGTTGTSGSSGEKGDQYRTVSTTCFTLGDAGTITVETGLAYTPGQSIVISFDASNYQISTVVSYNSGTGVLVFSLPDTIVGTPAEYCEWDVNLNGAAGGDGSNGTSGTSGSNGSNGTSGLSCLSATIGNDDLVEQVHVIYIDCLGDYNDYYADPGYLETICYQSGTLDVTSAGSFYVDQNGICFGTSGQSCNNIDVTNNSVDTITFKYNDCNGAKLAFDILSGETQTFCASNWTEDTNLTINRNGLCNGTSGSSGTSGAPGDAICPDHVKLASVSGVISTSSYNAPILDDLFIGNNPLGYSYGLYGVQPDFDGFGNITAIRGVNANCGIVLPVDLNEQDIVKISGIAYMPDRDNITNPTFYITVSHFKCADVILDKIKTQTFTVIPVAAYSIPTKEWKVCFSESISLAEVFPANETFFVVGVAAGSDDGEPFDVRFTYSLDVSQACIGGGKNLVIRNCCDPAYSEIIINNLIPVGGSFLDVDGNCWTIDSETENAVTGTRTIDTEYANCSGCIAENACPDNFAIESCCGGDGQVFTAALVGVDVGDTFVDTNGFCWSAIGSTGAPITNVVQVGTVYPATDCNSAVCVNDNSCPTSVSLQSCCTEGWIGYTTLEILQATLPSIVTDTAFVDTFGHCWYIKPLDGVVFPNMSFIIPDTDYGAECASCTAANPCVKIPLYYTVQNCCTEEVEVILLDPGYSVGSTLTLEHTTGAGCFRVLSWNSVGIPTITVVSVAAISKECNECLRNLELKTGSTCVGNTQCCKSYRNLSESASSFITGYQCDGTWVVNYELLPLGANTICMSQVWNVAGDGQVGKPSKCCFDIYNPSLTETTYPSVISCSGYSGQVPLPPQTLLSDIIFDCITCVVNYKGETPWEYVECPSLPQQEWTFTNAAFKLWPANTDGYQLYQNGFTDVYNGRTNVPIYNSPILGGTSQLFYFADGVGYDNFYVNVDGSISDDNGYLIYGNDADLYLNPGQGLTDGDTQNLWYRTIGNPNRWQTSILVYCGQCCGLPNEETPYSYVLNLYRDSTGTQYIETFAKSNLGNNAGPDTNVSVIGTPSTTSQVWVSYDDGNSWTYLGFGSVE